MEQVVTLDPEKPPGQQLAPEMRSEISFVAPSTVNDGDITTPKLKNLAVAREKIALGAVGSQQIAAGGVETGNVADGAIVAAKLGPHAVGPDKTGVGVVTAANADGGARELKQVPCTAAEYAALQPDPNTLYLLTT